MNKTALKSIITLGLVSTSPAFALTPEEAAIHTVIESVGTFADRGEFFALEALYAPEVEIDYNSLSGEPATIKSNTALMTEWANVLPGFDRTRHDINNITVTINGGSALASADVIADHWFSGQHWQVSGEYKYRLQRDHGDWKITFHQLVLTGEQGSRDLVGPAIKQAKANPNPYIAEQQARSTVMDFLTGLEDKDMERVNNVWAEDAVQDMPYSPPGHPKRVVGREALIAVYAGWPEVSGKAEFTDGMVFYPTKDANIVAVEYKGSVEVIPTGRQYKQSYFGLFHTENGKITLFREYYEPNAFAYAFGLDGS